MTQSHSVAGTLAVLAATCAVASTERRFVEDDFEGARVEAERKKVPILAEVWAPW